MALPGGTSQNQEYNRHLLLRVLLNVPRAFRTLSRSLLSLSPFRTRFGVLPPPRRTREREAKSRKITACMNYFHFRCARSLFVLWTKKKILNKTRSHARSTESLEKKERKKRKKNRTECFMVEVSAVKKILAEKNPFCYPLGPLSPRVRLLFHPRLLRSRPGSS